MICKKCGCRVSDTASFCDKCGAPMAEFGIKEQPNSSDALSKKAAKGQADINKWAIGIIAVILIAIVCGFFFMNQQKRSYANRAIWAIRSEEYTTSSIDTIYVYEKKVAVTLLNGNEYICNMLNDGGVQILTRYNYPSLEEKKNQYFNSAKATVEEKGTEIPISAINPIYR